MPPHVSDPPHEALPLTAAFYAVSNEEAAFFKSLTGLSRDEDLKSHVLEVQKESYNVFPYPCIRRFDFLRLKISKHPAYADFLRTAQDPNAVFLDIGCCFGNDIRKVIIDGYPRERVVGSDLRREFWDLGYKLFKQRHSTYRVPFLCGNVFDDTFLDISENPGAQINSTPLLGLQSLTQLKHRATTIHAAALFHLFNEDQQAGLARRLAVLLSPRKGSIIFGSHVARPVKGLRVESAGLGAIGALMFCHSDSSWIDLWDALLQSL
ncbi:hypothetical protein D9619_002493 [Psilocybe cf. subviscida]|uniref:Methyltransferase domain-containing protein n=1 Tax=Psilocybe cf. subviscida TaxID=2480587 RepID=A0A8H5AVZ2_9AGAR|nr:hypothetical protein D9619_002493 [Psilocybe cf. subviscida]